MMKTLTWSVLTGLCLSAASALAQDKKESNAAAWERSVVQVDVSRKQYDYFQPWTKRMRTTQKVGIVLPGNEILTTADEMFDRTLVRLQKGGRGKWWIGDVKWIDYHANLALVTTSEAGFWDDLRPASLAEQSAVQDNLQIIRWREGKLEMRKAEFGQFTVDLGHLSYAAHVQLEASSEIQGIGWGEPIIAGQQIVALASVREGSRVKAIPSSFIRSILSARQNGTYTGLGFFDFYWQPAQNPATLSFLKLLGEPRGVIVIEVPSKPDRTPVLKPRDILLQVDGFDIDIQGDYVDPEFGPLSLENLSTRNKWAGSEFNLKIWRDGKELDIVYRLPKVDYDATLVPDANFDQEPEYLIVGGLVFQPLNDSYLKSWGPDWKRRSPFRLYYYNHQSPTPERPALVFLSLVLPDIYNLGYQDLKYLVVDQVNGQKVTRLRELREALTKPVNGFHEIEFVQSDSLRRMIIDAAQADVATRRVMQTYGIQKDFYFASQPSAEGATTAAAGP